MEANGKSFRSHKTVSLRVLLLLLLLSFQELATLNCSVRSNKLDQRMSIMSHWITELHKETVNQRYTAKDCSGAAEKNDTTNWSHTGDLSAMQCSEHSMSTVI